MVQINSNIDVDIKLFFCFGTPSLRRSASNEPNAVDRYTFRPHDVTGYQKLVRRWLISPVDFATLALSGIVYFTFYFRCPSSGHC